MNDSTATKAHDLNPADGQLAYDLDRAHVFHSWSAQGALNPFVIAGGLGSEVWDYDGNTYLDFSSQLVNTNMGHQHPAIIAGDQGAGGPARDGRPRRSANLARGEAAKRIIRRPAATSARCSSPTAVPTRTRTRSGWRGSPPAATRCSRPTAPTTATPAPRSSRPATGAACRTSTRAGTCTSSVRSPTAPSSGRTRPSRRPSARCTTSSASSRARGQRRSPRSCSRRVPGTAGVLVPPPGYLAGVRALCDKYGIVLIFDEVMCGFGRTGDWFAWQGIDGGVVPDLSPSRRASTRATCPRAA